MLITLLEKLLMMDYIYNKISLKSASKLTVRWNLNAIFTVWLILSN